MGWEAASYLMSTSGPASFHGPAPYTPDGPEDRPYSDDDSEYDLFLTHWIAAVENGEYDDIATQQEEHAPWIS